MIKESDLERGCLYVDFDGHVLVFIRKSIDFFVKFDNGDNNRKIIYSVYHFYEFNAEGIFLWHSLKNIEKSL